MSNHDDFESPQSTTHDVTIGDKTRSYVFHEMSAGAVQELFADVNSNDAAKKSKASKLIQRKLISKCVSRADGTPITEDEAANFRTALTKQLERKILEVNGMTPEADAEAKNG